MNQPKKHYDIEQQATLLFTQQEIPLTPREWDQLATILARSEYQHIVGGDADESHSVWVSRYFNDVDSPQALSDFSKQIESIVMSPKMRAFYQQFTGTEKLCLRRCQANKLYTGDFIGLHKDQDSSPDYFATIVFHFSDNYVGGYFQASNQISNQAGNIAGKKQRYKPEAYTALVNNCSIPHQVTAVESGERLTLACFLSTAFHANKNKPRAFKVAG